MKRFLHRLCRAWGVLAPVALHPVDPSWTDADAKNLDAFLDSQTGLRLGAVLRHRLALAAAQAITRGTGPWDAGHAAGMHTAVAVVDSLRGRAVEPAADDDRPSDTLDWLHPRTETGAPTPI